MLFFTKKAFSCAVFAFFNNKFWLIYTHLKNAIRMVVMEG